MAATQPRIWSGRVVGAAADQVADVHVAVEPQRLVGELAEDRVAHVGDDADAHVAGAVAVEVHPQAPQEPHQHERRDVDREKLPRDPSVGRHDVEILFDRPFDLDRLALDGAGQMEPVDRVVRLFQQARELGIVVGRAGQDLRHAAVLLRIADVLVRGDPAQLGDLFGRNLALIRGRADVAAGIHQADQLRHQQKREKERSADEHAAEDAERQAFPVWFRIFQQPQIALGFEVGIVVRSAAHECLRGGVKITKDSTINIA